MLTLKRKAIHLFLLGLMALTLLGTPFASKAFAECGDDDASVCST